jgi:hypothetical protein
MRDLVATMSAWGTELLASGQWCAAGAKSQEIGMLDLYFTPTFLMPWPCLCAAGRTAVDVAGRLLHPSKHV